MMFMQKMLQAKKIEAEAILCLLPEQTKEHVEVIGKELTSMVAECFADKRREKAQENTSASGVRKVDID
jgi:hypothetical protein